MRIVLTRPREQSASLAAELAAAGHEVLIEPMLSIRFAERVALPAGPFRAVLLTSANAVKALCASAEWVRLRGIPAFAVGAETALCASRAGFSEVASANGDVGALAALVQQRLAPAGAALLYPSGETVAGDLAGTLAAAGFTVERIAVYASMPAARWSAALRQAIEADGVDAVLLLSPRGATAWAACAKAAGLADALRRILHVCLSDAVAAALRDALSPSAAAIRVAARPERSALLAAIRLGL